MQATVTLTLDLDKGESIESALAQLLGTQSDPTQQNPTEVIEEKPARKTRAKKAKAKEPEPEPEAPVAVVTSDKPVTIVDIREAAIEAINKRGREAVEGVFKQHGTPKLSGIPESAYAEVLAQLKALVA